jgi:hypothetical protein
MAERITDAVMLSVFEGVVTLEAPNSTCGCRGSRSFLSPAAAADDANPKTTSIASLRTVPPCNLRLCAGLGHDGFHTFAETENVNSMFENQSFVRVRFREQGMSLGHSTSDLATFSRDLDVVEHVVVETDVDPPIGG